MMLFHFWASERCWFHSRTSLYWPQNIPFTPAPLLLTVFYNVVWSLVSRRSYIKRPQLLAMCDTDSKQTSQQGVCGCALYEANLGWQRCVPLNCLQAYWKQLPNPPAYISKGILNVEQSVSRWLSSFSHKRDNLCQLVEFPTEIFRLQWFCGKITSVCCTLFWSGPHICTGIYKLFYFLGRLTGNYSLIELQVQVKHDFFGNICVLSACLQYNINTPGSNSFINKYWRFACMFYK